SPPTAAPLSTIRTKCPHCQHVQRSHRVSGLKRHIDTHERGTDVALWASYGLPIECTIGGRVPAECVRDVPVFEFECRPMAAECEKTFCRRSALMRRLRRGMCFGGALPDWQPGTGS
ncbi:hypothetical protein BD311DRAFT_678100, partial [Dichomitus squalens]